MNGRWTPFTQWSMCSEYCGGGTKTRTRTCTNPAPSNGGRDCTGVAVQTRECGKASCATSCRQGRINRWEHNLQSHCLDNGYPTVLANCKVTPSTNEITGGDLRSCQIWERNLRSCGYSCPVALAVDGGWSDYSDWSECSAECAGGTQTRTRTCTNPAPANGGAECVGESEETRPCNEQPCPGLEKIREVFGIMNSTDFKLSNYFVYCW